ncbi:MAG: hypothetical protein AAGC44_13160 [Planctomycetota bacterium]
MKLDNTVQGSFELGYDCGFTEIAREGITLEIAEDLIDQLIALPAGGGYLCFDPVYAIEINSVDGTRWAGAPCFDCGTYYSTDGRGPEKGVFDPRSGQAKNLLKTLKSYL